MNSITKTHAATDANITGAKKTYGLIPARTSTESEELAPLVSWQEYGSLVLA